MTKRALVLGGGGPVGIGWESGIVSGLMGAGVDLSQADFVLGTSAGSFVGANLAMGNDVARLAEMFITEPTSAAQPAPDAPDLSILIGKLQEAVSGARPAKEVRAEIAADGSFVVWDQQAGVGLARAVGSSCSVPGIFPPITIRGRRYIDGGMRSATNADVAKGYDKVLVIAVTVRIPNPVMAERFSKPLEKEIEILREGGAEVEVITPDAGSLDAFGMNLMDRSRRSAAAKAGLSQGRCDAMRIRSFWG